MKRIAQGLFTLAVMVNICSYAMATEEQLAIIEIEGDAARLRVSDGSDFHVVRGIVNALHAGGIAKSTISIGIEEPVEASPDTGIVLHLDSPGTTFICVSPNMPFDRAEFFQDELLKAGHEDVKFVSGATIAAMSTKTKELTPQEGLNTYPSNLPSASIVLTLVGPATLKSKEGYQVPGPITFSRCTSGSGAAQAAWSRKFQQTSDGLRHAARSYASQIEKLNCPVSGSFDFQSNVQVG